MLREGTCHFISMRAASAYYGRSEALLAMREGRIKIGRPKTQFPVIIDDDGRYHIEIDSTPEGVTPA